MNFYEIFRALNNGNSADWGAGLFDVDLLIIRTDGLHYTKKFNREPIDYLQQVRNVVVGRTEQGLPTWFLTALHCASDRFTAQYGGGTSQLAKLIRQSFIETRFGDPGAHKARFYCDTAIVIDPQTGERRVFGDKPLPLNWWSSETLTGLKDKAPATPPKAAQDPHPAAVATANEHSPRETPLPRRRPAGRLVPKSAAEIKVGEEFAKSLREDYEQIVQQKREAERQGKSWTPPSPNLWL